MSSSRPCCPATPARWACWPGSSSKAGWTSIPRSSSARRSRSPLRTARLSVRRLACRRATTMAALRAAWWAMSAITAICISMQTGSSSSRSMPVTIPFRPASSRTGPWSPTLPTGSCRSSAMSWATGLLFHRRNVAAELPCRSYRWKAVPTRSCASIRPVDSRFPSCRWPCGR